VTDAELFAELQSKAKFDPTALAILELHKPQPPTITFDGDDERVCKSDGADGWDWDYPPWPCRTIEVIAEQYGVKIDER
jgi:hypothetical protein